MPGPKVVTPQYVIPAEPKHVCGEKSRVLERPEEVLQEEPQSNIQYVTITEEKPKLIAAKCPDCGFIHYKRVSPGTVIDCNCGSNIYVDDLKFIHTLYNCDSCEERVLMSVQEGLDQVSCRQCRAPVDLTFDSRGRLRNVSYEEKR